MSLPDHNSDKESSKKKISKSTLPKRVITGKIEEFFQSRNSSIKKSSIFLSDRKENINQIKNFIKFHQKKIFFTSLLLLAIFVWVNWYLLLNYSSFEFGKISINQKNHFEVYAPIISTPLISDINSDQKNEVVFADTLGNIFSIRNNGELLYHFATGKGVIAPLTEIKIDSKPPWEVLVVNEGGKFFVLTPQGNYFYQSRDEFFKEKILSKPAFLEKENLFFLAGRSGTVWSVDSKYGEVVWVNTQSLQSHPILSAPLLAPSPKNIESIEQLLVLSEDGHLASFDKKNGFLLWELILNDRFKSSMSLGNFLGNSEKILTEESLSVALASLSGKVYLISLGGKILNEVDLKTTILGSPVKGWVAPRQLSLTRSDRNHKQKVLVVVNENGEVYAVKFIPTLTKNNNTSIHAQVEKMIDLPRGQFISSPVIVDFNQDQIDDILTISRSGIVYIIDGNDYKIMATPLSLNYQVSATPVVGDVSGDGKLNIVVAGENGRLDVLSLEYSPKFDFPKNKVFYKEFLGNSLNQN